jgi:hypothetical protein
MILLPELFAVGAIENIGNVVVGIMAVAGAFLIGNLLTWLIVGTISRVFIKRVVPPKMMKIMRIIGGILLALAVAYWAFREGGFGFGTGTGTPMNENKGDQKQEEKKEPTVIQKKEEIVKKKDEGPLEESIRIVVLGGDAKEQRFYELEGEKTPRTFSEITRTILERKDKSVRPLRMVTILVYKNSADRDGAVVRSLVNWAKAQNLGVSFPSVQNEYRPE